MKAAKETITEMSMLLDAYIKEVERAVHQGRLTEESAKTYVTHARYFCRWCNDDFEPGGRNVNQRLF